MIDTISNAYSGIRKEMWVLAIAMLINRSGSMVLLFMECIPYQTKTFYHCQAGFIMGLFGAGSFVGAFVGGKLVDRIGFYPILISSLVLSAICMISLAYVDHFFWIGLLTFLVTSTGDMFRPANAASISTYSEPENYPQSIALNRLASCSFYGGNTTRKEQIKKN
ncbi:MAG: MFS transporter [Bacteroidetes bacterium]|nr:MFS transporter [Bacteroidota bacterium]